MRILFLINGAPYRTEKFYNTCKLAIQLQKDHETDVFVFLMADAGIGVLGNQNTPQGYYNIERMLKTILDREGIVKLCGSCIDARRISELKYIAVCRHSDMTELAHWSVEVNKVFTF